MDECLNLLLYLRIMPRLFEPFMHLRGQQLYHFGHLRRLEIGPHLAHMWFTR